MAVAELGYKIDSSGAVAAATDLDDMTAAAIRAEAGAKGLASASTKSSAQTKAFGKTADVSTGQVANLGAQLNDIGVMLAAGQSPLQLAVQQGTQINQVFAQMGGGTKALRGLAAGFMSMVNPMSLAVIGTIAGVAALTQWGAAALGASKDAQSLEDDLGDLAGAIQDYRDAAVDGIDASKYIIENFGAITKETIALSAAMQDLRVREIMLDAADAANKLTDEFSGGLRSEVSRISDVLNDGLEWWQRSDAAALQFAGRLDAIRMADGPEAQLAAVRSMGDEFVRLTGGVDNMTKSQREYYSSILQTEQTLGQVVNLTADADAETAAWDATMQGVKIELNAISAIIASLGGGAISAAAKNVEIAALRAGKTVKEAAIEASQFQEGLRVDAEAAQLEANYGMLGKAIGVATKGLHEYRKAQDQTLAAEQEAAIEREKAAIKSGRGGGGGSRKQGGEYTSDLEALMTNLQTERDVVDAWYLEGQALLSDQRAMELLGVQEHNEAKLALEAEYAARLVEVKQKESQMVSTAANSMYGELGSLLTAFGNKSKGAAIAALAVNTALRISEVIQNTAAASVRALAELGPIAGPPAAAKIMAFGKVQAGLILANAALSASGSAGGGSISSSSSSGATAPSAGTTEIAPQTRAIVQVQGGRSRFTVDEINDIIASIQEESKDGVIIEGFTLA